jgi:hypothetical protein
MPSPVGSQAITEKENGVVVFEETTVFKISYVVAVVLHSCMIGSIRRPRHVLTLTPGSEPAREL